jgi:hypothetical protein
MEWLIAGVFGFIGLVGAVVVWIGRKDPKLKPYDPGVVRYPGAFGLSHPDEKPKDKVREPE